MATTVSAYAAASSRSAEPAAGRQPHQAVAKDTVDQMYAAKHTCACMAAAAPGRRCTTLVTTHASSTTLPRAHPA